MNSGVTGQRNPHVVGVRFGFLQDRMTPWVRNPRPLPPLRGLGTPKGQRASSPLVGSRNAVAGPPPPPAGAPGRSCGWWRCCTSGGSRTSAAPSPASAPPARTAPRPPALWRHPGTGSLSRGHRNSLQTSYYDKTVTWEAGEGGGRYSHWCCKTLEIVEPGFWECVLRFENRTRNRTASMRRASARRPPRFCVCATEGTSWAMQEAGSVYLVQ